MFVYGWSVLELRFGLLILSFYPKGSFVPRVEVDFQIVFTNLINHQFGANKNHKWLVVRLQTFEGVVECYSAYFRNFPGHSKHSVWPPNQTFKKIKMGQI